jgi:DNA (cytosine-5)-methyltransferase 1
MDGGSRGGRVKGQVATITPGKVFERILAAFASCGYQVDWCVVNSRHYLPQQRERVYIVGTRLDLACGSFQWDNLSYSGGNDSQKNGNHSSLSTVRDILEPRDSCAVLASELNKDQWTKVQRLYAKKDLEASRDGCIDLDGKAPTLISQYHRVGSFSTKYVFEEADGTPRHGGLLRPRFVTPRECCRLQGFPESFQVPSLERDGESQVAHFYRGIGNAVTPPVVTAIAIRLLNMLGVTAETQEFR